MKTFRGKTCSFHSSSDLSGDVVIVTAGKNVDMYDGNRTVEVRISSSDLLEFITNHFKNEKISQIEKMDIFELLNLK